MRKVEVRRGHESICVDGAAVPGLNTSCVDSPDFVHTAEKRPNLRHPRKLRKQALDRGAADSVLLQEKHCKRWEVWCLPSEFTHRVRELWRFLSKRANDSVRCQVAGVISASTCKKTSRFVGPDPRLVYLEPQ